MMTRFCKYIEKVFRWSSLIKGLTDSRKRPRIPTSAIFQSAMMMFATLHVSLNRLEGQLRIPKRWEKFIGKFKPSADRVGEVVALMDTEQLRDVLSAINHRLGRNKVLQHNPWPLRFLALDGHEFFRQ